MRISIAIAVVTAAAISLATPAQADACFDYHLALAARKASLALPREPDAGGEENWVWLSLNVEAHDRVIDGQTAVRASLKNEEATALIDLLLQLAALQSEVHDATRDWVSTLPGAPIEPHFDKLNEISRAIRNAREAVFREVCQ